MAGRSFRMPGSQRALVAFQGDLAVEARSQDGKMLSKVVSCLSVITEKKCIHHEKYKSG